MTDVPGSDAPPGKATPQSPETGNRVTVGAPEEMPRIIFSLQFELEDPKKPDSLVELIAPLDREGQSPHCKPCPGKRRVIDLRTGDGLQHGRKHYRIKNIRAYRDAYAKTVPETEDGYVLSEATKQ